MKIFIYRAEVCDQDPVYRSRVQYEQDITPSAPNTYSSVTDLALAARQVAWSMRSRRSTANISVSFSPPDDVEWQNNDASPLRCSPLEENDQEIFWQIFSRSKEDAERLKDQLAAR